MPPWHLGPDGGVGPDSWTSSGIHHRLGPFLTPGPVLRPSNPTLHAASRTLFEERGVLVAEWAARLSDRAAGTHNVPPELMKRHLRLMAVLLHLNRVIDRGIAVAVAGYTDALVAELYVQDGVPSAGNGLEPADVERQLGALERELLAVTAPPSGGM